MTFKNIIFAAVLALVVQSVLAETHLSLQAMHGPNAEQLTSSSFAMRMSKNGRFMMFSTPKFEATTSLDFQYYVQDMKSGETTLVSEVGFHNDMQSFGISESGQFIAYIRFAEINNFSKKVLVIKDLAYNTSQIISNLTFVSNNRLFVTNTGDVIYRNRTPDNSQYQINKYKKGLGSSSLLTGKKLLIGGIDTSGNHIAYLENWTTPAGFATVGGFILDTTSGQSQAVGTQNYDATAVTINASGSIAAVGYSNPPVSNTPMLQVRTLKTGSLTAISEGQAKVEGMSALRDLSNALDISEDGRFVSFRARLTSEHPDYNVAEVLGTGVFDRLFRLDVTTKKAISVSKTFDGSANDNFVNQGNYISNDSRVVAFAGAVKNLLPTRPNSVEEPYHAMINTFTSNYSFVGMPNSEQNWKHYSSMSLVADNTWQGVLSFDGNGVDAFKIDAGGTFSGPDYIPTANWSENYGEGGIAFGNNIYPKQGAGNYSITFNDITKQITMTKIIAKASTVDVTFTCHNANTYYGQSIYAVGSIDALGNWDVSQAIKLNLTNYSTWQGKIALPANTQVKWKCIKREEADPNKGVEWQGGADTVINTELTHNSSASF
ncbi:carbohydrate-binding module family 20 domain-containing protein [Colwelliaceae bacterium MEBiC 14330]